MASPFGDIIRREIDIAAEEFLKHRRPEPEIRHDIDIEYRVEGQDVIVYEIATDFRRPGTKRIGYIGKASFIRDTAIWLVYYSDLEGGWHPYNSDPEVLSITEFFRLMSTDPAEQFFG